MFMVQFAINSTPCRLNLEFNRNVTFDVQKKYIGHTFYKYRKYFKNHANLSSFFFLKIKTTNSRETIAIYILCDFF